MPSIRRLTTPTSTSRPRASLSPPRSYELHDYPNFTQRLSFWDSRAPRVEPPRQDAQAPRSDGRTADRWWTDLRDTVGRTRASDALDRLRTEGAIRVEQVARRDGRRQVIAWGEFGISPLYRLAWRLRMHRDLCRASDHE